MNPIEQACDSQRIDDYLDERLSDASTVEFECHLSHCEACQKALQQRSAEPEVWRDAIALLADIDHVTGVPNPDARAGEKRTHRVLSILDSLAPTDDPNMLGRIGEYEVSGVVGVGGMGAVLKGFDLSLNRVVAIKVMAPHLAGNGSARARFQREARAAAAITHDNVIDTYGVAEAGGLPYIVMPFARGPSLQKRIDESGPLTLIEVVRIGRQIASGLSAAHHQGLVHRDIKPANILLNQGIERLWITDFGVARAMDDVSMTQTGLIAGTPQYMSPEQARGEPVDSRSDLFSLGSVLYTACTGRPPFRSETAYGILRRINDSDPRPIQEVNSDIPPWLCRIVERLMAKHPADRFQNAGEVADLLDACAAHLQQPTRAELPACVATSLPAGKVRKQTPATGPKTKPVPLATAPRPPRRNRVGFWVMIGLAALAGTGVVGFEMTQPADISGDWQGENWKRVSLSTVSEASDWYSGSLIDSEGNPGAIQLEWSRLQRRYNGRWKVGDQRSGNITLRASGNGLRGAVSVDSDSRVAADRPRLREFTWQRASDSELDGPEPPSGGEVIGRPASVLSPIKGRVVRWGDGIYENARVRKGQLIAEVAELDPVQQSRLQTHADAAAHQVRAAENSLEAKRRQLEAAKTKAAVLQSQHESLEQAARFMEEASANAFEAAKIKVAAADAKVEESVARLEQTQANLVRQNELFQKELISELKLNESESKLREAKAKVKQAEIAVQAAENETAAKKKHRASKRSEMQANLAASQITLADAMADVAEVESEIAKAEQEVAKARREFTQWRIRRSRHARVTVRAPFSGIVTDLTATGTVLKQGDPICEIYPANPDTDEEDPPIAAPTAEDDAHLEPSTANEPESITDSGANESPKPDSQLQDGTLN